MIEEFHFQIITLEHRSQWLKNQLERKCLLQIEIFLYRFEVKLMEEKLLKQVAMEQDLDTIDHEVQ